MIATDDYRAFIERKTIDGSYSGFDPVHMPDFLFDFQRALVEWAIRKGNAAIFADCGLGKTLMQLVWAENVCRKTGGRVLILTPLAVAHQTAEEAEKFGLDAAVSRDGKLPAQIVVTNYERLHHFNADDFHGVVCDESSILKNFAGKTREQITDFMSARPYRLLCTATPSPNDYVELGTSSEALGVMERKHMLAQYFTHDGGDTAKWRLKGHARSTAFWQWVCDWARACRKPSDLGFHDGDFSLPGLTLRDHVVHPKKAREGYLFDLDAVGLDEQREDLRRTLNERCEMVAELANSHGDPVVCWTNLNAEADLITRLTRGAVNVQGSDSDEEKERAFADFAHGRIRVIVSKPSIAGFGLNWQHCAHMTFFPSHSYEQFYQCVRRCWRFGQKKWVTVDMVTTPGQSGVLANMERKAEAADAMFGQLVEHMNTVIKRQDATCRRTIQEAIPSWL